MAEARYDQDVRRDKDLLPYVYAALPEPEFGDIQFDGEMVFGNGEDGDVTISADTSLSEDMYYSNLIIDAGKTLNPNGWRVFVKNTLTLNGDFGVKESVGSIGVGSLSGTVAAGVSVVDGLGGAGEPDGYVSGYTFTGTGSVTSSVGVSTSDFYDLRAAINAYQQRGSDFIRGKGGAGGGTGAAGVSGAGAAGSYPPNANTVGAAGGKGSAGSGGTGGGGGRGGAVVMLSARVIAGTGGIYCEGGGGGAGSAGSPGSTAPSYHAPASTNHHEGPNYEAHTAAHDNYTPGSEAGDAGTPAHDSYTPGTEAGDAGTAAHDAYTPGAEHHEAPHEAHEGGVAPHDSYTPGAEAHNAHYTVQNPTGFNPGTPVQNHHFVPAGPPGVFEQVYADHTNPPVPSFHHQAYPAHDSYTPGHEAGDAGTPDHDAHDAGSDATGPGFEAYDAGVPAHDAYTPGFEAYDAGVPAHDAYTPGFEGHNPAHDATTEGSPQSAHVAAQTYVGGAGGTGYTGQRGGRGGGGLLIVVTRDAGTPGYSFNTGVNGTLIALDTANI
jgi:hypothetical protein